MSQARHAKKRDSNEGEIVAALKQVGATVIQADAVDLIVGFRGNNFLLEAKTKKGTLTDFQKKLRETWCGQYAVVRTPEEALKAIGATQ